MREIFAGGGEMGALMAAHDWSRTPLGPPRTWPQSLKAAVGIMLTSRFAIANREVSMMPTAAFRLCGQFRGGPSGVRDLRGRP